MNKKEDELIKCRDDLIDFIENHIIIKDVNGRIIEFKLNRIQKVILESLLRNSFKNMRTMYITKDGQKH